MKRSCRSKKNFVLLIKETNHANKINKGEQDDPLMPMLFALGQHQALVQTQAMLRDNEKVMAFLDDIHIATPEPDRVMEAHTVVAEELWSNARIQVHLDKTQVWNRGGIEPAGMDELTRAARLVKPDAIVWKGDPQLPLVSLSSSGNFSRGKEQATLFERIPWVNDPQAAYLLLLMCWSTRANFLLRAISPDLTEEFATRHDIAV